MYNSVVLIPAYKPDKSLLTLIEDLHKLSVDKIVIVRDGGGVEFDEIFNHIKTLTYCHLLEHKKNMGKGIALKTGFEYIIKKFPNCLGCITADADGQHLPIDIVNILKKQSQHPNELILGVRGFDKNVPLRSQIGNYLTKWLLSIILFKKIKDSQTGLRGISLLFVRKLLKVSGIKYEFELNMLLNTKSSNINILQIPINTIYIENNKSSHFNPIIDSMKIYFLMLRFIFSSISSFLVDYLLFLGLFCSLHNFLISFLISRLVSLSFNYYINKNIVFKKVKSSTTSILKYLGLVIINFLIVFYFINYLQNLYNINIPVVKIILEIILFMINFYIQKKFIFSNR